MTRTKSILLFAILTAFFAATATAGSNDDAALETVRKSVSEMFEMIDPEHVNESPVDGWYEIRKGSIVAYISGDGRYLLQGDLIDLDQNVNLSEAARDGARRDLISTIPDDETILFSPVDPKYRVTVFTDVECTYCRRLHSQIQDYMDRGIEVRYLLYPRNGPASRSWNTAEKVWCADDRANALTLAKLDRSFETQACDASMVQHHWELGHEFGLAGTPAIVLDDGTLIGGYMTPDQLKAQLDKHANN